MSSSSRSARFRHGAVLAAVAFLAMGALALQPAHPALAQEDPPGVEPAPDRGPDEGEGPYERLVVRGATVVDGTGAPPRGPMDVVIEGDRIVDVGPRAAPDLPDVDDPEARDTRVLDARGMYVLPGFVDLHGHVGGAAQGTPAEYVFKLWMAHGITTIRDPGSGNGLEWMLRERERSARDEIVAPRIFAYLRADHALDGRPLDTPERAREWVRWLADQGADGIKVRDTYDPEVVAAILREAERQGLGTAAHITQMGVAETDALDAARAGLTTLEHWYGLPEALFDDRTVQHFPPDFNYANEYHRFREAGRLWKQAAEPGSDHYEAVTEELLELGLILNPTLTIYEANRDVMREREAEWHDRYTLPSLWEFFQPDPEAHGSYWFRWSTADEIAWRENFRIWMDYLEDYKNRGGQVCTGSDSGFIYKIYGFGYIGELELLQEAGFHPLEVIRSATLCGARALAAPAGRDIDFGVIRPGLKADLVIVEENPLEDFKVLYGTGAVRLDEDTGEAFRTEGVKYTVKNGIVYDAQRLLDDVERMVREAREEAEAGR